MKNGGEISANVPIFITVNRNGFVNCWLNEPTKNNKSGKWIGKYSLADSIFYKKAKNIVKETCYSWQNDEPIILTLNKNV